MKKRMRQALSLLLSLMMVLIILPTSAFAAEPGSDPVYFPSQIVDNGTTYTYNYDNGALTYGSNGCDPYDILFMLPKDTNLRNIVLCETADFYTEGLHLMFSDAITQGKITSIQNENGRIASYNVSNGLLNSFRYNTASHDSTIKYSKGKPTSVTINDFNIVVEEETSSTYKISYKNGAVSYIDFEYNEGYGKFTYTTDKQGRVTKINYKTFGGDEKIGTLNFTYDSNNNLTKITNNYHWNGTPKTKVTETIKMSYNNGSVSRVTTNTNEEYGENHTITAEYQAL